MSIEHLESRHLLSVAPVAVDDYYYFPSGAPFTLSGPGLLRNDFDVGDATLYASLADPPRHGTVTINRDAGFTYTPTGKYEGTDEFRYSADNGAASSPPVTVSLRIKSAPAAPTDIQLSQPAVAENRPAGTYVGTLTTVDPNPGNSFKYELAAGAGDGDNRLFTIDASGNLRTAAAFDCETRSTYSVRVRSTDSDGLRFERALTVAITDVRDDATLGLVDPLTSLFYLRNSNSTGAADLAFGYGAPGQGRLPLAGDCNGDGTTDVGMYDPNTSIFYLTTALGSGVATNAFGFGPADKGWTPSLICATR